MDTDNFPKQIPRDLVTAKKTYKAPSFRFEPVFEVSALQCGKIFSTQSGCHSSRKAS